MASTTRFAAELLLQQILSKYPQSTMIDEAAYQLGDIYESRNYHQFQRAAIYFERCFQWNKKTQTDARLRAAHLYEKQLNDKAHALEIYKEDRRITKPTRAVSKRRIRRSRNWVARAADREKTFSATVRD